MHPGELRRGPARWQVPAVDAAALALARHVRESMTALRSAGRPRWLTVLDPLVEPLEDGDLASLEAAARRVRAAFGVGESVAEDLAPDEARVLRDAADATLRELARYEARRGPKAGATLTRREDPEGAEESSR